MTESLRVMPDPCPNGWPGCDDNYTHGHYCEKQRAHEGRCKCPCGATSTIKRGEQPNG